MATAYNPTVARAFVELSFQGRVFGSNMHFIRPAGWDQAALTSLANAVNNAWDNHVMPQLSEQVNFDGTRAYDMGSPVGPVVFSPISQPAPGGIQGEVHSLTNAVVITLRTPARGRSGRGRIYVSGVGENQVAGGALLNAAYLSFEAAAVSFFNALTAAGLVLCVYSTEQNGQPLVQGDPITVTDVEIRTPILGAQRRRTRRP